jgi:hypothetical protein
LRLPIFLLWLPVKFLSAAWQISLPVGYSFFRGSDKFLLLFSGIPVHCFRHALKMAAVAKFALRLPSI